MSPRAEPTMRYVYIDAGARLSVRDEPKLSLDNLQTLVGGYIEGIYATRPNADHSFLHVLDNEDGIALGLGRTVKFPKVYTLGGTLLGPVVIMAVDPEGEQRDMTDAELACVTLSRAPGDVWPTLHVNDPEDDR